MSQDGQVVLGITPAFDEGVKLRASKASLYLRREYTRIIAEAGAVPMILSPDMPLDYIVKTCDGLVISGGEDIPAEVYDGRKLLTATEPLERVSWERHLIDAFAERNKPVLGVCYGMQLLALHYGGGLFQDIATERAGSLNHVRVVHEIVLNTDFLGLKKGQSYNVASRHHQAVSTPPEGFTISAVASDGVIEAMQRANIFGVQWHPESDLTGQTIYAALKDCCEKLYKQG